QPQAPFGDAIGVGNVDRHRHEGDERDLPAIEPPKNAAGKGELQKGRRDRKEGEGQQRIDRLGAAFDDAGKPTCLALEVKAQGQRVEVAEGAQSRTTNGSLSHPRKEEVAQFLKTERKDPGEAIGQDYPSGQEQLTAQK